MEACATPISAHQDFQQIFVVRVKLHRNAALLPKMLRQPGGCPQPDFLLKVEPALQESLDNLEIAGLQ